MKISQVGLSVENLDVRVGTFRLALPRLVVAPSEICVVMGESGSGKSTLLAALGGFLPLESGTIFLAGQSLTAVPPERRKMASVFQKPSLFPHLSVFGNVEFGLKIQGLAPQVRREKVNAWLERLEIADLAARMPSQISGGQAQRVSLARALVVEFPILLLDEPFAALDEALKERAASELKLWIADLGIVAIWATHSGRENELLASQTIKL